MIIELGNISNYFIREYPSLEASRRHLSSRKILEVRESKFNSRENSLYILPTSVMKSKQIYEEFITIGIETDGLECSNVNEIFLTPKILANFPNNLEESELRL